MKLDVDNLVQVRKDDGIYEDDTQQLLDALNDAKTYSEYVLMSTLNGKDPLLTEEEFNRTNQYMNFLDMYGYEKKIAAIDLEGYYL